MLVGCRVALRSQELPSPGCSQWEGVGRDGKRGEEEKRGGEEKRARRDEKKMGRREGGEKKLRRWRKEW